MKRQLGYTLFELISVLWFALCMAGAAALVYAVVHFISKFW